MSYTTDPRRLGGVARLYGEEGAERLARSHVVVVGTGGVGSWAAEALARTGVGRLTIIDGDKSALSNTNRQLHAMDGNYGQYKVELLKARFALINPELEVSAITAFVTAENAERLLPKDADWVVDCIDDLKGKTVLVATAKRLGCKVVVSGGAGGKRRPSELVEEDLARIKGDPLAAKLRTNLRRDYGFPAGSASGKAKKFGILAVTSAEAVKQPDAENLAAVGARSGERIGFGSGIVVTGSVGLRLAAIVINDIVENGPVHATANAD